MEPVKYQETTELYAQVKQKVQGIDGAMHMAILAVVASVGICVLGANAIGPDVVAALLAGVAVGLFIYSYKGERAHKKELDQWSDTLSKRLYNDLSAKPNLEELKKMRELMQMCPKLRKKLDKMAQNSVQSEQFKQNLQQLKKLH